MNFVEYCLVSSFFSSPTISFMPPLYLCQRKCAVFFPTGSTSPYVITCVQSVFPSRMDVPCRPVPHSYNSSAGHWCQTQWLAQTKHSVSIFFWMNAGQDEQKDIFVLLYIWLCWSIWIFSFWVSFIHTASLPCSVNIYWVSLMCQAPDYMPGWVRHVPTPLEGQEWLCQSCPFWVRQPFLVNHQPLWVEPYSSCLWYDAEEEDIIPILRLSQLMG